MLLLSYCFIILTHSTIFSRSCSHFRSNLDGLQKYKKFDTSLLMISATVFDFLFPSIRTFEIIFECNKFRVKREGNSWCRSCTLHLQAQPWEWKTQCQSYHLWRSHWSYTHLQYCFWDENVWLWFELGEYIWEVLA